MLPPKAPPPWKSVRMPTTEEQELPLTSQLRRRLERAASEGGRLLALIDGARVPGLWKLLEQLKIPHKSLFRDDPNEDLRDWAPYLVAVDPKGDLPLYFSVMESAFDATLFFVADASVEEIYQHFRRFLLVRNHEETEVYFRFYDPRVLVPFLAVSTDLEKTVFFGPVRFFFAWNQEASQATREIVLRGWRRPAPPEGQAPPPPSAANKFRLSRRHNDAFAAEAVKSYDQRLAAFLRDTYIPQLANASAEDVAALIGKAKQLGPELGLTSGADITTVAELLVIGFPDAEQARLRALPPAERSAAATALRDKLFPEAFR